MTQLIPKHLADAIKLQLHYIQDKRCKTCQFFVNASGDLPSYCALNALLPMEVEYDGLCDAYNKKVK